LETTHEGVVITDTECRIQMVNRAFTDITGYQPQECIGLSPSFLRSGLHDEDFYDAMWHDITHKGHWQGEIWNRRKNGEIYPQLMGISQVKDREGIVTNYAAVFTDITQLKASERELQFLAHHDPLTQLPNRILFISRLQHAIDISQRQNGRLAVLMMDLDRFKAVNDTFGHPAGDELLKLVAECLTERLRATDTVCRIGGDEFVILLEELGPDSHQAAMQAETASRKVVAALREPFSLDDHAYLSTGSIGVTLFDGTASGVDELLKQADIAMYEAKQAGRNGVRFFDPEMQRMVVRRALLENALRRAEIRKEFLVHYQPQWLRDGTLAGFEALVRWMHPQRGLLEPGEFIEAAEETGIILTLGQWVLDRACQQLAEWSSRGRALRVSVNVSAAQLHSAGFVDEVREMLARHRTPPARLTLELTESMLVRDVNATIEKMAQLRKLGVRIALDDFGTGYSSLSLLQRLPLDDLKIDASFVHRMTEGMRERQMVQAIVTLGKNMALNIIAEGIETEGQQAMLEGFGCDEFQGFFHGRSMPAADARQLALAH